MNDVATAAVDAEEALAVLGDATARHAPSAAFMAGVMSSRGWTQYVTSQNGARARTGWLARFTSRPRHRTRSRSGRPPSSLDLYQMALDRAIAWPLLDGSRLRQALENVVATRAILRRALADEAGATIT